MPPHGYPLKTPSKNCKEPRRLPYNLDGYDILALVESKSLRFPFEIVELYGLLGYPSDLLVFVCQLVR